MRARVMALVAVAGALGLQAAPAAAQNATAWVHVRVEEAGKGSKVNVNLPLPAVEAALAFAPPDTFSRKHIQIGGKGQVTLADLRRVWKELEAAGDTELVSVEEADQKVTVARQGTWVQVRVSSKKETVRVDVPVTLVDALLSGTGEQLNVRGAIDELRKLRGDIVQVRGEDSTVRVWIDERS